MPRPVILPPIDATPEEIAEALFNYRPEDQAPPKQPDEAELEEQAEAG